MNNAIIRHYERLLAWGDDPVHDPPALRAHMDQWDGPVFLSLLDLSPEKAALEIGVGTGRLAVRTAPLCRTFCGIDLSPAVVRRTQENLAPLTNVELICGNFLTAKFDRSFDAVYSSLTFMHIRDKQAAVAKAARLLSPCGRFVLSIDKNPRRCIDAGMSRIEVYPDDPEQTAAYIRASGLNIAAHRETEAAHIFAAVR